jgi:hypothetical protein
VSLFKIPFTYVLQSGSGGVFTPLATVGAPFKDDTGTRAGLGDF